MASGHADAPPVILLHGSGANSAMWRDDASTWSTRMRVFAVDLPGEPGLSLAARPPLASDAYVRWLTEVLDGLSVDRASFVGISLGGWLATQFAIRRADRVNRLVLLSPSGIGRQKTSTLLLALALLPFGRPGRELAMGRVLGAQLSGTAAGEYVLLIHEHFRPRTERVPIFTDFELTRVAAPTLVVVGQNDALLTRSTRSNGWNSRSTCDSRPHSRCRPSAARRPTAFTHFSLTRPAEPHLLRRVWANPRDSVILPQVRPEYSVRCGANGLRSARWRCFGAALQAFAAACESLNQDRRNAERYDNTAQALQGSGERLDDFDWASPPDPRRCSVSTSPLCRTS